MSGHDPGLAVMRFTVQRCPMCGRDYCDDLPPVSDHKAVCAYRTGWRRAGIWLYRRLWWHWFPHE